MDKGLYRRKVLEDEEAWRSDFFRCQERERLKNGEEGKDL